MKPSKLFLIAVIIGAMAASSAVARPTAVRTQSPSRNVSVARASSTHWARNNNNWRHYRHHRHSRAYFAFGYPFGYGYPYYGYYPYGYGYYGAPREAIYQATVDRSIVLNVQRRLARAGFYHGAIDGVIGYGTRNAIRSYERANGLRIDGQIDQRLLVTLGLA